MHHKSNQNERTGKHQLQPNCRGDRIHQNQFQNTAQPRRSRPKGTPESFSFSTAFGRIWAGTSPKKFLQYMAAERAKKLLKENQATLFETAYETGLSGTEQATRPVHQH